MAIHRAVRMTRTVGWAAVLCLGAGVLTAGAVAAPHSEAKSAVVSASMFPAATCHGGNARGGLAGSYLACKGVNDWWDTAPKPYTISFGGYVNTTAPVSGPLVFKEWSPTGKKPIYRYRYGIQHLGLAGEWFEIPVKILRDTPGDYFAALYFRGKEIGWTPVNVTAPGASAGAPAQHAELTGAILPAATCTDGPASYPYVGYDIRCDGITDWWSTSSGAYTVTLDGFLNTTAPVTGTVEVVESAPGASHPVYQYSEGVQHVSLSGEWFHADAKVVRDTTGDYGVGLYFNGKLVAMTPVNVTGPAPRAPGRHRKQAGGRYVRHSGHYHDSSGVARGG